VEPRWLDEREEQAWRGFQRMRSGLSAHLARELARDTGLTEADYAVLVAVSEAPGRRIRSRELGRTLGWDRSRLSHQVSRMQARGTIRREPCADDARGFDVVITPAGFRAIQDAAPLHVAAVRRCFADLLTPQQLDVLTSIADTITSHLAAEHSEMPDADEG
jgi:DNA-binding MarR family transcriptional regulator